MEKSRRNHGKTRGKPMTMWLWQSCGMCDMWHDIRDWKWISKFLKKLSVLDWDKHQNGVFSLALSSGTNIKDKHQRLQHDWLSSVKGKAPMCSINRRGAAMHSIDAAISRVQSTCCRDTEKSRYTRSHHSEPQLTQSKDIKNANKFAKNPKKYGEFFS